MKYFVDSCIWRDFYEGRFSRSGRDLGRSASKFLLNAIRKKHTLLYSDAVIRDLKKDYVSSDIDEMFGVLFYTGLLKKVEMSKEEVLEAENISLKRKVPLTDCMIAVQARNNNAIVVSQDGHFFVELSDIAKEAIKLKD